MSKKRMPAGESRQETSTTLNGSSRPSLLDNWLDTGPGARASKEALTWTGEPVKRSGPPSPEPKDKLDTKW